MKNGTVLSKATKCKLENQKPPKIQMNINRELAPAKSCRSTSSNFIKSIEKAKEAKKTAVGAIERHKSLNTINKNLIYCYLFNTMFRKYIYLTGAFIFGCCCPSSQAEFPAISECKLEKERFLKLEDVQVRDCFAPNTVDLHKTVANPQTKRGSELKKTDVGVWIVLRSDYFLIEIKDDNLMFYDGSDRIDKLFSGNPNNTKYGSNHDCFSELPYLIENYTLDRFELIKNKTYYFSVQRGVALPSQGSNININDKIVGHVTKLGNNHVVCIFADTAILNKKDIISFSTCSTDFAWYCDNRVREESNDVIQLCPIGQRRPGY